MARIQGDLCDRSFAFGLAIIEIVESLPQRTTGWELGRQLFRSGTGVVANVREADNALSDAEFASKCGIARKEAAETNYWLGLGIKAGLLAGENAERLAAEADELARILATMVRRTQIHLAQGRPTNARRRAPA